MSRTITRLFLCFAVVLSSGCGEQPEVSNLAQEPLEPPRPVGWVDSDRVIDADAEPQNWFSHGRTYGEQRFSPLDQIDSTNVHRLGLAWYVDLDTRRGQQATPLVVDGIMYSSSAWSKVQAIDAASGRLLWQYDPAVDPEWDAKSCCGAQNRGVAVWKGNVYVGTLDGRLIAIDAETGEPAWSVQTTDGTQNYSITGAPRIVRDLVVIGNGGAEFGVVVTSALITRKRESWRGVSTPCRATRRQASRTP